MEGKTSCSLTVSLLLGRASGWIWTCLDCRSLMEVSMLDILKSNLSKVYCKPRLLLFVVVVLLGENSIRCNGGGFAASFGADSIFYTQEEVIWS